MSQAAAAPIWTTSFGGDGSGNGQFSSPYGIAIHPNGKLYIADLINHRIQIFNYNITHTFLINLTEGFFRKIDIEVRKIGK